MPKRVFDIVFSGLGLLVLSPVLAVLAIWVKLSSPGPAFYQATRVGHNGTHFKLLKFRSMVVDADKMGPAVTSAEDTRITTVGRLLRRTKLDELPQLLNVLRGEMSLVGPRPEDPRYVELYTPEQQEILQYRPGITSMASLAYRNEEQILSGADWEKLYVEEVMPTKIAIDLEYSAKANILSDIWLIVRTIFSR